MYRNAALPFVLRRSHDVVSFKEISSTQEEIHGLLRLDGDRVVIQWRSALKTDRVGLEIRTDRKMSPVREATLPVTSLAGARVRRDWKHFWLSQELVLNAADLRTFDALMAEGGMYGLVLEHPAEMVLQISRKNVLQAKYFASELNLAISEHMLKSVEDSDSDEVALQYAPEIQMSSTVQSDETEPSVQTSAKHHDRSRESG